MTPGRRAVARHRSRLDAAFDRIQAIGEDELEARADFARYLCVLVSGYLEQSVNELLFEHCRQQASESVQRYARWHLVRFGNATKGNIVAVCGRFDESWGEDLEHFIVDERAAAVGSIVKERHRIAHGENSDISYVRVRDYREKIDEVIDRIAELADPVG